MKKVLQNIYHIFKIVHLVFTSINAVERKQSTCDNRILYFTRKTGTIIEITVSTQMSIDQAMSNVKEDKTYDS